MKEIRDILRAYQLAHKAGMRAALATVVKVEGSSYRRPGARMLVTEDGQLTGAISGGCLEGDARRKALLALEQNRNKLVTYDSMDEEGEIFGIQLGCNGIVHILFEPIGRTGENTPLAFLERICAHPEAACLATVFQEGQEEQAHSGTCLLRQDDRPTFEVPVSRELQTILAKDANHVLREKAGTIKRYPLADGSCEALLDYIAPPVSLVIAGAGNDAVPVAQLASLLGWNVSVIDGRPAYARKERFPMAESVQVVKQGDPPPPARLYMLMSHNYAYDFSMLRQLVETESVYIGILGPGKKRDRMLADLAAQQVPVSAAKKIHGPAGLDIGAETAEEIALSVIAEMKAVLAQATALPLRDKEDYIHPRISA